MVVIGRATWDSRRKADTTREVLSARLTENDIIRKIARRLRWATTLNSLGYYSFSFEVPVADGAAGETETISYYWDSATRKIMESDSGGSDKVFASDVYVFQIEQMEGNYVSGYYISLLNFKVQVGPDSSDMVILPISLANKPVYTGG